MKVLLVLACVAVAAVMAVEDGDLHDHPYDCDSAGVFTDPADNCEGFHVCSYNFETKQMEHVRYVTCGADKLFNGRRCVPVASGFTCPY